MFHPLPDAADRRGTWHRVARATAPALLALLLTGCPLTGGGGIDFSIRPRPTEPASITLAPGQSAPVRVSFSISVDNPQGRLNSVRCEPRAACLVAWH